MTKEINTNYIAKAIKIVEQSRNQLKSAINMSMVYAYYEIGRIIAEEELHGKDRAEYGKEIISELSLQMTNNLGKGFSVENLNLMRRFYQTYSKDKIDDTVFSQSNLQSNSDGRKFFLSFSHYVMLMSITDIDERHFYEIESYKNNWSLRELKRQFNSSLYERLMLSKDKEEVMALALRGQKIETAADLFKDPYVLEFTGLPELTVYSESDLEKKIIDNLASFLLELGRGFSFVGRQKRFTYSDEHYYVDLVFYNRLIKSFVLLDLKIGKLQPSDLGQMQMYVNYYDRFEKSEDENPTVGIILCKNKEDAVVEITLPQDNKQIFASTYQTVLPSKDELKQLLSEQEDL